MEFWDWIVQLYVVERLLCILLLVGLGLLMFAAIVSYVLRSTGIFAACMAIAYGVFAVVIAYGRVGEQAGTVVLSSLLVLGGTLYLCLFIALSIGKSIAERKRRRAEIVRRLCYTLPERDNSYVRARLNTALKVEESKVNEYMGAMEAQEKPMRLEHARQLLCKVKEASLSKAERLQADEMEKTFSMYLYKERWTAADIRAVNELCAALLKLSAKYAV